MRELFMAALQASPFVSGGAALMLFGGLLATLRNLPGQLAGRAWSQCIVTLDVSSEDEAFDWLTLWLARQPYSRRARRVVAHARHPEDHGDAQLAPDPGYRSEPTIHFAPAPGAHFLAFRGRPVWLTYHREQTTGMGGRSGAYVERYELRVLGRSTGIVRALLAEARACVAHEADPRTLVLMGGGGYWRVVARVRPRTAESVILPDGQFEALVADVGRFLGDRDWYRALGVPYRRGLLFHGVPGSGKTSAIMALAGHFGLRVHILTLSAVGMNDESLATRLLEVPERAMVLLEDVDAIFVEREGVDAAEGVTFSGLLNALDGAAAGEGRILCLTTNHPERLDPALIRPGRVDVRVAFGPATADQAARLFDRFFPDADAALRGRFAAGGRGLSMAVLQQELLGERDDPHAALAAVERLAAGAPVGAGRVAS